MLLLPTPRFLGEGVMRGADGVRFAATGSQLLTFANIRCRWHTFWLSSLLLLMFASAMISLAMGVSQSIRDILDVFRLLAFWTILMYGVSLGARAVTTDSVVGFLQLLLGIGVANAGFTIIQKLFPIQTQPLQYLFYHFDDRHILNLPIEGRAFGFFFNPNTNCLMLMMLSLAGLALYQITRKPVYRWLGLFVLGCMVFTGSRTGLLITALVISIVCIASGKTVDLILMAMAGGVSYIILDFMVTSGLIYEWTPYLAEMLVHLHSALQSGTFDAEKIGSYSARKVIWDYTLPWFYQNPIFGAGPLREVIPSCADNYFIYLLARYGLCGLGLYLAFILYGGYMSWRAFLSRSQVLRACGLMTFITLVIVNVANYSMDAFPTIPMATMVLIHTGYLAGLCEQQANGTRSREISPIGVRRKGLA